MAGEGVGTKDNVLAVDQVRLQSSFSYQESGGGGGAVGNVEIAGEGKLMEAEGENLSKEVGMDLEMSLSPIVNLTQDIER